MTGSDSGPPRPPPPPTPRTAHWWFGRSPRRWLALGAAGVFGASALLFLQQRDLGPVEQPPLPPRPWVAYAPVGERPDTVLAEQSVLLDPTPLVLPSVWSSASDDPIRRLPESASDLLASFPAEAALPLTTAPLAPPPSVPPLALLQRPRLPPLEPAPPVPQTVVSPATPGLFAVVQRMGESRPVRRLCLAPEAAPSLSQLPLLELPARWQVLVDAAGLVGRPLLIEGTGNDELDLAFRDLVQRPALYVGLPAGYYRVWLSR